jgi:hypothetical protein
MLGMTEGEVEIILAVYQAPQRPSNAMGGFSRRISQSGKSRHLFQRIPTPEVIWNVILYDLTI